MTAQNQAMKTSLKLALILLVGALMVPALAQAYTDIIEIDDSATYNEAYQGARVYNDSGKLFCFYDNAAKWSVSDDGVIWDYKGGISDDVGQITGQTGAIVFFYNIRTNELYISSREIGTPYRVNFWRLTLDPDTEVLTFQSKAQDIILQGRSQDKALGMVVDWPEGGTGKIAVWIPNSVTGRTYYTQSTTAVGDVWETEIIMEEPFARFSSPLMWAVSRSKNSAVIAQVGVDLDDNTYFDVWLANLDFTATHNGSAQFNTWTQATDKTMYKAYPNGFQLFDMTTDWYNNTHIIWRSEVTDNLNYAKYSYDIFTETDAAAIDTGLTAGWQIGISRYLDTALAVTAYDNILDDLHLWYNVGSWVDVGIISVDSVFADGMLTTPISQGNKWIGGTIQNGNGFDIFYYNLTIGDKGALPDTGWVPPIIPSFVNVDLDDSNGWLFEYEDYHLTVEVANCNETVSLSLQLKGGNWNATYNNTDGTVAASGSEDIEVVKVTPSGVAALMNYDIHFILTQNIADQLNVPLYVSATGPYGPVNWTIVNTLNIYNEGGLTNYSFVGWSGHDLGDHPFEVFSADTRTPTLIDLYTFDVRSEPLTVNQDESELLSEIRADWEIVLPYRAADADIYPTHRLASYADPSDRGYISYPFSLYVVDQAVDAGRQLYLEKEFRRVIRTSQEELVTVQWYAMTPDVDQQSGQYRIQSQSIARYGSALVAVQMRFDSASEIEVYNISGGGTWDTLLATADYDWYLLRCELNMTSQTVDFYEGGVFIASAPFAETCNELGAFFIGTINSVTTLNEFYTDNVWAFTDFDLALGGVADVNQVYRKLQSWDMHLGYGIESPDGVQDAAMGEGYIEFGVDYVFGDVWVPEYSVRITPNATELNSRNNWIKYKVEWNHTSTGQVVKTEFIYGLYEADTKLGTDFLQREITSLFADFWVDQANSSSIVGGRVNVEWYGISDKAPWYQFWGQEWKPKITDIDRSQILMPLMDENGTVRQAFEIKLCRIWARSYRSDFGTFHHKITHVSQFDTNEVLGLSRFEGQDTPYFNEPKTPAMSNAGLFGPVYSLIGAIGKMIVTALIAGANGFIGLADSMLVFLGINPGFFHSIVSFLGLIPEYILGLMVMVGTALSQLLGFITPMFELITYIMTFGLVFIGQLVSKQLEFWRLIVDLFQGGVGMPFNFWVDFNIQAFITLGMVVFPMNMYIRWSSAKQPMKTVREDVTFAMTIVDFLMGLYRGIAELLSSLISLILELIPV